MIVLDEMSLNIVSSLNLEFVFCRVKLKEIIR